MREKKNPKVAYNLENSAHKIFKLNFALAYLQQALIGHT